MEYRFQRRPAEPTKHPRKVRGGQRIPSVERATASWAGQRLVRLVELAASGAAQAEGLEYATLGQTRRLDITRGVASGLVQGRMPRAYRAEIELEPISEAEWQRVIEAMLDQALYAAKLLAGELPPGIEDLFAPLGLRLFPTEPAEIKVRCGCLDAKALTDAGQPAWCKHACCVSLILADRLAEDPWLIFLLRGMPRDEVLDHLRHRRAVSGATATGAPVYVPHVEPLETMVVPDLEDCIEGFWETGPGLHGVQLSVDRPEVSHPLLRRLGASPFPRGSFPIVGLLATCYEVIADATIAQESDEGEDGDTAEEAFSTETGGDPDAVAEPGTPEPGIPEASTPGPGPSETAPSEPARPGPSTIARAKPRPPTLGRAKPMGGSPSKD